MVMIDWISAVVPLANAGELHNGRVVSMDADGVIEWQAVRRLEVEGSYSTKLQVRGRHDDALEFSGNPSKYLQGHNVFGSGSVVPLMNRTLVAVAGVLPGVLPSAVNLADWLMFQLGLLGLIYSLHSLHGGAARQATPQASVSAAAWAAVLLFYLLILRINARKCCR